MSDRWDHRGLDPDAPLELLASPLEGLNADQRSAATHLDGPAKVVAGAGSGKTRALISRIAWLVEQGVKPHRICGITFTRKAAQEMRERVGAYLHPEEASDVRLSTFHSLALRILRVEPEVIDRRPRFALWDDAAMQRQLRYAMKDEGLPGKITKSVKDTLSALVKHKEQGLRIDDPALRQAVSTLPEPDGQYAALLRYERMKVAANALDFADLIWGVVVGAQDDDGFRGRVGERYDYVQVDEYQDTNAIQAIFLRLLAPHRNIMVVGDDDQAIYGFRGADHRIMAGFEQEHPSAKLIFLGQNYRCSDQIVRTADASVRRNGSRMSKRLWSERGSVAPVKLRTCTTPEEEAQHVAKDVADHIFYGSSPSELAVLCRTRRQVRQVASALTAEDVPCRMVGASPWWRAADTSLVLSWLRLLQNGDDIDAARKVITETDGLGESVIKHWSQAMGEGDATVAGALRSLHSKPRMGPATRRGKAIARLADQIESLLERLGGGDQLVDVCDSIFEATGIDAEIEAQQSGDSSTVADAERAAYRCSTRDALLRVAGSCGSGLEAIEELTDTIFTEQRADRDSSSELVTVSTIHGSKGLEWQSVWLVGASEGLLPSGILSESGNVFASVDKIDEERRLYYVACTRAKDSLVITSPLQIQVAGRWAAAQRSRFVNESYAGTAEGIVVDQGHMRVDMP